MFPLGSSPREQPLLVPADANPQAVFLTNWHIEVIAAKLAAVAQGKIQRLIINLPPLI